jgi:cysteine desulfuration protein SufE
MNSLPIEKKIERIKFRFNGLPHGKIIEVILQMGQSLPLYPLELKTPVCRVAGCQSILFLSSFLKDEKIIFNAASDALLSVGLAALLISVYSEENPETILTTPPRFLTEIGLLSLLTPSRATGLAHIHQRMKKDALKWAFNRPPDRLKDCV